MAALLALVSSLLWGSADFLGGTLSRRFRAVVVVLASQASGLVLALLVAVVTGSLGDGLGYLPWAICSGAAGVVGLVCFYAALASGTMGIVSPIAALGVVVPVVVGLASGESPAAWQVVGIVVAIGGVVLASGPELSGRAGARPLLLAGVAAVGFGLALLFIAKGSAHSTVMTLVAMRATSVTLLGGALAVEAGRRRRTSRGPRATPKEAGAIALVGAGDLTANLTFGLASTRDDVSIVAVLGSLYPVVTVLMARFLHGERLGRVQVAGVAGALVGVALIAAGDRI